MMDAKAFQSGILKLASAFGTTLTKERIGIYWEIVSRLSPEQWENAVRRSLESETFFPAPACLLRYGATDGGALTARAGEAHERITRHFEKGERLGYGRVRELYGKAAAEGFIAAGGAARFEWCDPDAVPFRLKEFKAAYVEVAEIDPSLMLPASGEPSPEALEGAAEVIERIAALAGEVE